MVRKGLLLASVWLLVACSQAGTIEPGQGAENGDIEVAFGLSDVADTVTEPADVSAVDLVTDVSATTPTDLPDATTTADVNLDATHDASEDAALDTGVDAAPEVVGLGPPYPIVLCHGFFGFNDFAGAGFLTYFYKVKQTLQNQGEYQIYTPSVDPFGSSDARAKQLDAQINEILKQTGKAKVVLVGHSQGGLDARIIAHDHPEKVAALLTVATPHQGSPVADAVLVLTPGPISKGIVDAMGKLLGGTINPSGATSDDSVVAALSQFSSKVIPGFNATYPDVPGMPFWSIAGRSVLAGDGGDCSANNPPAFMTKWTKSLDPCNATLVALTLAMIGQTNDGLVPVNSAKRGVFLGCVPADHLDEIGQILGQPPGLFNKFDHLEFWSGIVQFLRAQGL